jgi:hypothetical protein
MEKKHTFDGGYNRVGEIALVDGVCSICGNKAKVIEIDGSEGEYEAGRICKECASDLFRQDY